MTEDELKAIDKRLADMSQRVDAVIEKESRGKRMPVLDFKPRSRPKAKYVPPYDYGRSEERWLTGRPQSDEGIACNPPHSSSPSNDCIDQIFADFERQFDEMAQAHRQRG